MLINREWIKYIMVQFIYEVKKKNELYFSNFYEKYF